MREGNFNLILRNRCLAGQKAARVWKPGADFELAALDKVCSGWPNRRSQESPLGNFLFQNQPPTPTGSRDRMLTGPHSGSQDLNPVREGENPGLHSQHVPKYPSIHFSFFGQLLGSKCSCWNWNDPEQDRLLTCGKSRASGGTDGVNASRSTADYRAGCWRACQTDQGSRKWRGIPSNRRNTR
jgi:hypothetical protein